jgi:hypothetical protein
MELSFSIYFAGIITVGMLASNTIQVDWNDTANILIRRDINKRSAEQDKRLHEEAAERKRQRYQHDHPYAALNNASDFDEEETP